jgi:hypothetical protein
MPRKLDRQDIFIIGILLLALVMLFMTYREGFTSVNSIPTANDFTSINSSSPTISPTMQKMIDYIKGITWSTQLTDDNIKNSMFSLGFILSDPGLDKLSTLVNGYSSRPTFQQALTDWNNLRTNKLPDSKIQDIIQTGPTENPPSVTGNGMVYKIYTYIFGEDTSTNNAPQNQPLTLYVPQPCTPSFKSIPGGAVDINCFN